MASIRAVALLAITVIMFTVSAEKRQLDLILTPSDTTLHYAEGFIRVSNTIATHLQRFAAVFVVSNVAFPPENLTRLIDRRPPDILI